MASEATDSKEKMATSLEANMLYICLLYTSQVLNEKKEELVREGRKVYNPVSYTHLVR